MRRRSYFRVFLMMFFGLFVVGASVVACIRTVLHQRSVEAEYHDRYGEGWQEQYEQTFGSLSDARIKMGVAAFGVLVIPALAIWLAKTVKSQQGMANYKKMESPKRRVSTAERRARYRRNAVVGIYFGLGGVVMSLALIWFRWGISRDHANEVILGIFVFVAGYVSIISGCYWWLKAKQWTEEVVLIGVFPLILLFIPFVRKFVGLMIISTPLLLPAVLTMTSLLLIVVVAPLPDKSGGNNQRMPWSWKDLNKDR